MIDQLSKKTAPPRYIFEVLILEEYMNNGAILINPIELFVDSDGLTLPDDFKGAFYRYSHHLGTHLSTYDGIRLKAVLRAFLSTKKAGDPWL